MPQTCFQCGAPVSCTVEARYHADLPEVVLDGLEVRRCPQCGESVVIRRIDSLRDALVRVLLRKRDRLVGPEVRFLRECAGWSEPDLARHLAVSEDVARAWEDEDGSPTLENDRTLRIMVAALKGMDLPVEVLAGISGRETPLRARAWLTPLGWKVELEARA